MKMKLSIALWLFTAVNIITNAQAATFIFTGDVNYVNTTNAALFGVTTGTTGTFTATLDFDTEAASYYSSDNGSGYKHELYNIGGVDLEIGTQNWHYNPAEGQNYLLIQQDEQNTYSYDQLYLGLFSDETSQSGLTLNYFYTYAHNYEQSSFNSFFSDDLSASQINLFNTLAQTTNGGSFRIAGGSTISFTNISMAAVSAVPLPAGVWLFGTVLMGMVGVKRFRGSQRLTA